MAPAFTVTLLKRFLNAVIHGWSIAMTRDSLSRFNFPASAASLCLLALIIIIPGPSVQAQTAVGLRKTILAPSATELRIVSTEFKFSQSSKPVIAGRPVTIVLDNSQGETEHTIAMPALGLRIFARAGGVMKKDHVFEKPGEYEFVCDLPGHMEAGMKGRFSVIASDRREAKGRDAAKN